MGVIVLGDHEKIYHDGKIRLSLILEADEAIKGLVGVLEYGAEKYGRGDWLQGMNWSEVSDSALRHLMAFQAGEDIDEESGLLHVDLALSNLLFLAQFSRTHPELDDRSKA